MKILKGMLLAGLLVSSYAFCAAQTIPPNSVSPAKTGSWATITTVANSEDGSTTTIKRMDLPSFYSMLGLAIPSPDASTTSADQPGKPPTPPEPFADTVPDYVSKVTYDIGQFGWERRTIYGRDTGYSDGSYHDGPWYQLEDWAKYVGGGGNNCGIHNRDACPTSPF